MDNTVRLLTGAFVLCVMVAGGCTTITNVERASAAVRMQANGADPLDIPCAISEGTERYCEMRAATKAQR